MVSVNYNHIDVIYNYIAEDRSSLIAFSLINRSNYLIHIINQGYIKSAESIKRSYNITLPIDQNFDWISLKKAQVILFGEFHYQLFQRHSMIEIIDSMWQEGVYSVLIEGNSQIAMAAPHIKLQSRRWDLLSEDFDWEYKKQVVKVALNIKTLLIAQDENLKFFGEEYKKFCSNFPSSSIDSNEKAHLEFFLNTLKFLSNNYLSDKDVEIHELKLKMSKVVLLHTGFTRLESILQSIMYQQIQRVYSVNTNREINLVSEILRDYVQGKKSIVIAGHQHVIPTSTTVIELSKRNIDYIILEPKQMGGCEIDASCRTMHADNVKILKDFYPDQLKNMNWFVFVSRCIEVIRMEKNLLETHINMLKDIIDDYPKNAQ